MKKIFLFISFLTLTAVSYAEIIESVSFNPSRFGQYERLVVSESAHFRGGLSATNMNVGSGTGVTVNVARPLADHTAFNIPTVDAVTGTGVSFPDACFSGAGSDCKDYTASSATLPNTSSSPLVISHKGGTGAFNHDSFVNRITSAVNTLKVKTGQVRMGKLTVQGKGNSSPSTYSGNPLEGVKLAGNDIPAPTAGHTRNKSGATAGDLKDCELKWEDRNTVTKSNKFETYRLLALNCTGSGGGTEPTLTCADSSYKASHKSECCPSAPQTDTVCWKTQWGALSGWGGGNESMCEHTSWVRDECTGSCSIGQSCFFEECGGGVINWASASCEYAKNGW